MYGNLITTSGFYCRQGEEEEMQMVLKLRACLTIHILASFNISTALLASFVYNLF